MVPSGSASPAGAVAAQPGGQLSASYRDAGRAVILAMDFRRKTFRRTREGTMGFLLLGVDFPAVRRHMALANGIAGTALIAAAGILLVVG